MPPISGFAVRRVVEWARDGAGSAVSRHRGPEGWHPVRRAAGRGLLWLVRAAVVVAGAVALAPVTVVAGCTFWYGWWQGTSPRRIYAAALCCLPMVVAWLVAVAVWPVRAADPAGVGQGAFWFRVVAAP